MATKATTLLNGTTADANEVMSLFDPLYTDIDETNVDQTAIVVATNVNQTIAGNKTFTGTTTLAATTISGALTAAGATFSGDVAFDTDTFYVDAANNRVYVGSNSSIYADYQLQNIKAQVGGYRGISVFNLDNTNSASHAVMSVVVGGSSAGDPALLLDVTGVKIWSVGLDNSDSDTFKIGANTAVGTNTMFRMDSTNNTGTITLGTQTGGSYSTKVTVANNGELLLPDIDPPTANYLNRNSGVKGWVKFVGTNGSIEDSYNVTSVTDNGGVGSFTINWDTNFANDDYACSFMADTQGSERVGYTFGAQNVGDITVVIWQDDAATATDVEHAHVIAIGDQ